MQRSTGNHPPPPLYTSLFSVVRLSPNYFPHLKNLCFYLTLFNICENSKQITKYSFSSHKDRICYIEDHVM